MNARLARFGGLFAALLAASGATAAPPNVTLPPQAADVAQAVPTSFSLPPQASEVAKGVFNLGRVIHEGRELQGYAFVHPHPNHAKPDGTGRGRGKPGGGGSGGDTTTSSCYAFIAKGARWKSLENYLVAAGNQAGMSESFVNNSIDSATAAWNSELGSPIFGSRVAGNVDGADSQQPDNKNEVMFSAINDPGVIAVTITWGVFSGPPRRRELVEWDQVYDDVDFAWGNADTNTSVMDMLNIAAHEVGHAAGLAHPDAACTDETMYAYAGEGETKKRDLNAGDITGVNELYK